MEFLLYLIGGCFVGLLSGLLGIGGGLIIVPFLSIMLPLTGVHPAVVMHLSIGTASAVVLCTTLMSAYSHYRRQGIAWPLVIQLLPGLVAGAVLGGMAGSFLPNILLEIIFAFFAIFMALKLGFNLDLHSRDQLPSRTITFLISTIIGGLCSMLGMGGGVFIIPFLRSCKINMLPAVAVAAFCAIPIAAISTGSYLVAGLNAANLPPYTIGFIYLPAFLACAAASMAIVPWSTKLAHRLPAHILQRIFAVLLFVVAINMLFF